MSIPWTPFPDGINSVQTVPRLASIPYALYCALGQLHEQHPMPASASRASFTAATRSCAPVLNWRQFPALDSLLASTPRAQFSAGVNFMHFILCWRHFSHFILCWCQFHALHSLLASILPAALSAGVNFTHFILCLHQFLSLHSLLASVLRTSLSAGVNSTRSILCLRQLYAFHSLLASVSNASFSAGVSTSRTILCWRQLHEHNSWLASTPRASFIACVNFGYRSLRFDFSALHPLLASVVHTSFLTAAVSRPLFPVGVNFPGTISCWRQLHAQHCPQNISSWRQFHSISLAGGSSKHFIPCCWMYLKRDFIFRIYGNTIQSEWKYIYQLVTYKRWSYNTKIAKKENW